MKNDTHFWLATMARGALALLVGSAVMVIPDMAKTLLLLPFAVAISILCLAAYGVLDSVLIFITSFMTQLTVPRIALRMQGTLGIIVGITLFSIVYDRVRLEWFLYLIAFQALSTAIGEFIVARHASTHSTSLWNYAAAVVAFLFLIMYLLAATILGDRLSPREMAWLIYGYLGAFGLVQCLTAARMLYADHQLTDAHSDRGIIDHEVKDRVHS
jgi:hypothetical protein